jgi:hypothetical protein
MTPPPSIHPHLNFIAVTHEHIQVNGTADDLKVLVQKILEALRDAGALAPVDWLDV